MSNAAFKNVTVQLEPDILVRVDERADRLDLNRSQYLRRLVRKDLGESVPELSTPPLPALNGNGNGKQAVPEAGAPVEQEVVA